MKEFATGKLHGNTPRACAINHIEQWPGCPLLAVVSSGRRNTFSQTQEMEWIGGGSKICSRFQCGVAEEELRNRWRCAFAAQPSGLATQGTVARDLGLRNPSRTRFK